MTTIPDVPGPAVEPANRFTPDAQERMLRLREMAAAFPDEADPRPLTPAEMRLARSTPIEVLENGALLLEAAPVISGVADVAELREAMAFELAYAGVRDEAAALARRIDLAILRRKLKAARAARGVYRVARSFITLDAGNAVRTHFEEMQRSLGIRRRRRNAPAPAPPIPAKERGIFATSPQAERWPRT